MAKKELSNIAVGTFCDSMEMMLKAGIQPIEAVSIIMDDTQDKKLETALEIIHGEMEQGSALAAAVKKTEVFPEHALKMIGMGERTGRLEITMQRLSVYYMQRQQFSQRLESLLRYPAIIIIMISAILAIMLVWVLPVFTGVYERLTGSVASSSYSYVQWAKGLCLAAMIIMFAILALIIVGSIMRKSEGGRKHALNMVGVIPPFGAAIRNTELCRFFNVFVLMLTSGTDEDTAMSEAMKMPQNKVVLAKLEQCRDKMESGMSFAQAAYEIKLLKPRYARILLAGDRSGNTDRAISQITELIGNDSENAMDSILAVAEPALSGAMLVTVSLSIISVMLPLIGIMNTIG